MFILSKSNSFNDLSTLTELTSPHKAEEDNKQAES